MGSEGRPANPINPNLTDVEKERVKKSLIRFIEDVTGNYSVSTAHSTAVAALPSVVELLVTRF
ncbi:MAG: hypothetical protein K6E42_08865 [Synergistes sp.]|nr:hypothetical protein [Synergistes sp.]